MIKFSYLTYLPYSVKITVMKNLEFLKEKILKGKRVAVTGPTGGLGRELCFFLAKQGAEIILLDRNKEKSDKLKSELSLKFSGVKISRINLDLEDLNSVKSAVEKLESLPLDFLIHNAGAYAIPRRKIQQGFDNVFAINFLHPFFITKKLLPEIEKRGGKIIVVGSIAHNYSKTDPEDIDFSSRSASSLVYGNAKRYLMYAHLNLKTNNNSISVVHPGITFTNITAHYSKLIFAIIKYPMKIIFMKPKKAVFSLIAGFFCDCPKFSWIGPKHFNIWGKPAVKKLNTATEFEIEHISSTAEKLLKKIEP